MFNRINFMFLDFIQIYVYVFEIVDGINEMFFVMFMVNDWLI